MDHLTAGDSCSIVGIGSVGKSNLLRFLQREDVRQAQLGAEVEHYLFVYVDTNKMLKPNAWGLMELMLHQMLIELENRQADEIKVQAIDDLHQRASDPDNRSLTLRYLDRACGIVCNQLGLRLVFLIDEFDELCRTMSQRGFAALRALRDEFKYRLMYVVTTRLELKRLRANVSEIEAFEELLSSPTVWLGPYSDEDARFMLRRLGSRHETFLDDDTVEQVLTATGRHPGLLREAYQVARQQPADLIKTLAGRPSVQAESQRIWLSLSPDEQQAMVNLANDAFISPDQQEVVERLHDKGLVSRAEKNKSRLFSPAFAEYVRQQSSTAGAHIVVDHKRHTVFVQGREIKDLTPLEFKLMAYLEKKRGQVCTRDELAEYLYPEDMTLEGAGVSDTRLDSVVKRLRKQIEPDSQEPRYILTVRGAGFRLVDGPDTNE
jgi:DNA-binding response OmpR family regulator